MKNASKGIKGSPSYPFSLKVGNNLTRERENLGISQEEFARRFAEFENRDEPYHVMTISNWETGKKYPPFETYINIALFYGLSLDYLVGLTEKIGDHYSPEKSQKLGKAKRSPNMKVSYSDLAKYDGDPVYVVTGSEAFSNQWGILDWASKKLVVKNGSKLLLKPEFQYYLSVPIEDMRISKKLRNMLNYKDAVNSKDPVWIESLSQDGFIKGRLDGWYEKDDTGTFFINKANGQALPFSGINITYNVFSIQG